MHLGSGAHWVCGSLPWGPMFCVRCSVLLGVRCSVPLEVWCSVPLEVQCYVPGVLREALVVEENHRIGTRLAIIIG